MRQSSQLDFPTHDHRIPHLPPPRPDLLAPPLTRRMACWLYEGMLMFGVVFIAGYLFSALTQTRNALDNRHWQQAFLFVVFGIYFTWFWSKGQTLAMKTWHIRVVDSQGQADHADPGAVALRLELAVVSAPSGCGLCLRSRRR